MNIAIVLAGGTGQRVGLDVPKQFIKVRNKPILAYTLEIFQSNNNIDAIEIVCHKDWVEEIKEICTNFHISKMKWLCLGGSTFQESVMSGIYNLENKISREDNVVITFGVSPLTTQEDIDDSIRVCNEHGNGIASKDIELCTCFKDDDYSGSKGLLRESIKGFANPWTFKFGDIFDSYKEGQKKGILKSIEPHTTSLYFALGKKVWFSKSTSPQCKITQIQDIDIFEGYLLLKERRNNNDKL